MDMPSGSASAQEHHHQLQAGSSSGGSKGAPSGHHDANNTTSSSGGGVDAKQLLAPARAVGPGQLQLAWRRLPGLLNAAGSSKVLFTALCGPGEDTFWLDR
jgi:hypothetical protein